MDIVNLYFNLLGENPTEEDIKTTTNTFKYLLDNNLTEQDITDIFKDLPPKTKITPDDLPVRLWSGSLLNKNIFYYHNELKIISIDKFDLLNPVTEKNQSFIEMKIKYTIDDVLDYYYKKFPEQKEFSDYKQDVGTIKYLLTKYTRYNFIEAIDILLYVIDEAYNTDLGLDSMIELNNSKAEKNTLKSLKLKVQNARGERCNKIMWR